MKQITIIIKMFPEIENEMIEKITPRRFHSASKFPTAPIDSNELILKVTTQLREYGNVVPTKSPQMIEELCKGFNECIRLNKNKEEAQILVFSPKIGSAQGVAPIHLSSLLGHTDINTVNKYLSLQREASSNVTNDVSQKLLQQIEHNAEVK